MATPNAPCPLCGVEIPITSYYCRHCKQNLPQDAQGRPAFNIGEAERAQLRGAWYCTQCGSVGDQKRYTKGSLGMEIILWLLFILPGVLYSVWRLTSKYAGCPKCRAANMIPVTSPVARVALRAQGS